MKSFKMMAMVIGLSLAAAGMAQARGHAGFSSFRSGNSSHFSTGHSDHHGSHFSYSKFGIKNLNYSRRYWYDRYSCYLYWYPNSSCWYFYDTSYSCYLPWQYNGGLGQPGPVGPPAPPD